MSVAGGAGVPDGLVRRIAERFCPDKIILFGSCARGDAGPESDLDLLVLVPDVVDPNRRAAELYARWWIFRAPPILSFRPPHASNATECGEQRLLASLARRQISL
jgi:hypothetical protein